MDGVEAAYRWRGKADLLSRSGGQVVTTNQNQVLKKENRKPKVVNGSKNFQRTHCKWRCSDRIKPLGQMFCFSKALCESSPKISIRRKPSTLWKVYFLTIDKNECCQFCKFPIALITKTQNKIQSMSLKKYNIYLNSGMQ